MADTTKQMKATVERLRGYKSEPWMIEAMYSIREYGEQYRKGSYGYLVCPPEDKIVEIIANCFANSQSNTRAALEGLREIHSTLDKSLGDTDATHIEDEEELRDEYPVQWAAQKLAAIISSLERVSK